MVYSVFYYSFGAIARALAELAIRIAEWREAKKKVFAEKKERAPPAPSWGFFKTANPYGNTDLTYIPRNTSLSITIPQLIKLPIQAHEKAGASEERLYFTVKEAASKDWFKEIEELAKALEKGGR